jgi:hypothetical protein
LPQEIIARSARLFVVLEFDSSNCGEARLFRSAPFDQQLIGRHYACKIKAASNETGDQWVFERNPYRRWLRFKHVA